MNTPPTPSSPPKPSALHKVGQFLRVMVRRFLRLPKWLLGLLMGWLGLVALLNLALMVVEPAKYALPMVNDVMETLHASALDVESADVWVMPWGTVLVKVPKVQWQSYDKTLSEEARADYVLGWWVRAQSLTVPVHLWRFPFGGRAALLGTIHADAAQAHLQGEAGLSTFRETLETFKPDPSKPPSPFTEHVKARVGELIVRAHNMPKTASTRAGDYLFVGDALHVRWHREGKQLQVALREWQAARGKPLNEKDLQPIAAGELEAQIRLEAWLDWLASAPAGEAPLPQRLPLAGLREALKQEDALSLKLRLLGLEHLLSPAALEAVNPILYNYSPELQLNWRSQPLPFIPALEASLKMAQRKATRLKLTGNWADNTHDQFILNTLKAADTGLNFEGDATINLPWGAAKTLAQALEQLGWQLNGKLQATAPRGGKADEAHLLSRLLADAGLRWRTGGLDGQFTLAGEGATLQKTRGNISTQRPLVISLNEAMVLPSGITLPASTRLENIRLNGTLANNQLNIQNAQMRLGIHPRQRGNVLTGDARLNLNSQNLTLDLRAPRLDVGHLQHFMRQNPRLTESIQADLFARDWRGSLQNNRFTLASQSGRFTYRGTGDLQAPHPDLGWRLPLALSGPVFVDETRVELGRANSPLLAQVARQAPARVQYGLDISSTGKSIDLNMPQQALSPWLAWADVFGVSVPASFKSGDTLGLEGVSLRLNGDTLARAVVERGRLSLEAIGDAVASAECGAQCRFETRGDWALSPLVRRFALQPANVTLEEGQLNWQLSGQLNPEPFQLNALNGSAVAKNLGLQYAAHPQRIEAEQLKLEGTGTGWQLNKSILNWGPLAVGLRGEGALGEALGKRYTLEYDVKPVDVSLALASPETLESQRGLLEAKALDADGLPESEAESIRRWLTWWQGLGIDLPARVHPQGIIKASGRIENGTPYGTLALRQVGGYFPTFAPDPVSQISGTLHWENDKGLHVDEDELRGFYGLSPWRTRALHLWPRPNGLLAEGKLLGRLHPRELNRLSTALSGAAVTRYPMMGEMAADVRLWLAGWNPKAPATQADALLNVAVKHYGVAPPPPPPQKQPNQSTNAAATENENGSAETRTPLDVGSLAALFSQASLLNALAPELESVLAKNTDDENPYTQLRMALLEPEAKSTKVVMGLKPAPEAEKIEASLPPKKEVLDIREPYGENQSPEAEDAAEIPVNPAQPKPPAATQGPPAVKENAPLPSENKAAENEEQVERLLQVVAHLKNRAGKWALHEAKAYPFGAQQPLYISASLDAPQAATHLFSSHGHIWTPDPIQLNTLRVNGEQPYESGFLDVDLAWKAANGAPLGFIIFDQIKSPRLEIAAMGGEVRFTPKQAALKLARFETAKGSSFNWQAQMPLPQPLPFQFRESHIHSPYWELEDVASSFNEQLKFWRKPFQRGASIASEWQPQKRVSLPMELQNTLVTWELGVFQNIAVQNGQGLLNLYQNGLVLMEDTNFNIVDGKLLMALTLDPFNDNAIHLRLKADNVPANPVFYGLTGVQQLVIGNLSGEFDLSTSGSTNDDFLSNVSGKATVRITEGRVPELVTVENILSKVSVVRGGLLNLELSDIASFLKQADKDNPEISETYEAELQMVNGLMLTDRLVTDGERMDLNVKGSMALLSGYSDMIIRANLEHSKADSLSPFQFSLRKALKLVPLLGKLPGKEYGLIDYVPVVGYIPAFGFNSKDTHNFYVQVQGQLDNPKDYQLPQWLNGRQTFNSWRYTLEDESSAQQKDAPPQE